MSGTLPDYDSKVRAKFSVKDVFVLPDGEAEYDVSYSPGTGRLFKELEAELSPTGYAPWMSGSPDDCVLTVRKKDPPPSKSRLPLLLALLTVASVVFFAILENVGYGMFAPNISGGYVFAAYAAGIVALLGVQEVAHMYAERRAGSASSTRYIVPGIPIVTNFLPSLGVVSTRRQPAVNRNSAFDALIAGPLALLAASTVLYIVGTLTAVQSSIAIPSGDLLNPNLIQALVDAAIPSSSSSSAAGLVMLSPLADAATIGFILAFFELLPLALFDGGYLALLSLGSRAWRVLTYVFAFLLVVIDTPNYWAPAVLALLLAGRVPHVPVLDDVSSVSRNRKVLYLLVVLLAFAALPIPKNLASVPLG